MFSCCTISAHLIGVLKVSRTLCYLCRVHRFPAQGPNSSFLICSTQIMSIVDGPYCGNIKPQGVSVCYDARHKNGMY